MNSVEENFKSQIDVTICLLKDLQDCFLIVESHLLDLSQLGSESLSWWSCVSLGTCTEASHSAHATHAHHERVHSCESSQIGKWVWLLLLSSG